ncbi:site-specific integrase, partial [Bacteroides uniformis]|nr:site-specific integrase [Bacteroides uniformis]
TDVEAFIPLHPIAGQILDLYNTTDDDRPVFPLPVRDVLWYEVHGMGVALGMKENLSYHLARHITFSYPLKTRNLQILSA